MSNLKKILAALVLLAMGLNAGGMEIVVGDRAISVPPRQGFVELTPQMSPYYESMRAYIAPANVRFLTLVTEDEAQAMLRGDVVRITRYMNVETEKSISAGSVSTAEFAQLRGVLRDQFDDIYANAASQLPEMFEKGDAIVGAEFEVDVAVELGGMVPLPLHLDTETAIASSMYVTVNTSVDDHSETDVLAATIMTVLVKDKVLFLYVYGSKADLEWTRETAAAWASDIARANPMSADERRAALDSGRAGIDWAKLLQKVVVGGLIGGIIGLIAVLAGRRKNT